MFKARTESGRNNIVGIAVHKLRKQLNISQRELADRLRINGLLDINKNAVQKMESGQRFINDIEVAQLAKIFSVSVADLYENSAE